MGGPGRARHRLPRPGGPSPGAGRARPGAGALTRRIRALPDGAMSALTWDQGSEMARHQRQGRRHRGPGALLHPPPQPLGKGHEREHQPPPRAATCPKAPPSPATNPCPAAIANEPGNSTPTRSTHPTHHYHPLAPPIAADPQARATARARPHCYKLFFMSVSCGS